MAGVKVTRAALQLANRVVRPLDRLAAAAPTGGAAPLMVVGLPRSGTTLAYELLVQAFDVRFLTRIYSYAYGLPNTLARVFARTAGTPEAYYSSDYGRIPGRYAPAENAVFWDQWLPTSPNLGHYVAPEAISNAAARAAASTLSSMTAITGRPWVFKNVYMTLSLPAFFRLLPEARVVVVKRDLSANIASVYNRRGTRDSWWSIRPPFSEEVLDRSILEQTVFQCVRSEQILDASLRLLPAGQYISIDYASLCESPVAFIEQVANWVGSSFQRRIGTELPRSFTPSEGPGIARQDAVEAAAYREALCGSRDRYLDRVQAASDGVDRDGRH